MKKLATAKTQTMQPITIAARRTVRYLRIGRDTSRGAALIAWRELDYHRVLYGARGLLGLHPSSLFMHRGTPAPNQTAPIPPGSPKTNLSITPSGQDSVSSRLK